MSLPDFRGYALSGLDGMGNGLAGRLTSSYFGAANADALGAIGGVEQSGLTLAQLPTGITVNGNVSVSGSVTPSNGGTPFFVCASSGAIAGTAFAGNAVNAPSAPAGTTWSSNFANGTFTGSNTLTSNNTGGVAHPTIGPRKLITVYIKL